MISGYASVFYDGSDESQYALGDDYVERIMPGAFDRAVKQDDVVGLFNHNPDNVLGRSTAGTLKLKVDDIGLRYSITDSETRIYQDVKEMQARGEITGSSFGFVVTDERIRQDKDGRTIREILEVKLYDVGPVTYPAYEATSQRQRRCVTARGKCDVMPAEVAAEIRSRMIPEVSRYDDVKSALQRLDEQP